MSVPETEGAREDLILKFEGMGFPFEVAVKLADEVMYGRGVAQENQYRVSPGRGFNTGGSVDTNQYGLGQFSVPFSSLDGGESASTPDKAIKNALKSGDASDEYLVALAKADKAKSPAARKALLDIANEKNMADKFSYNMGMFG
jgi:hypothetical protein